VPAAHRPLGDAAELFFNKPLTVTDVTLYSSVIRKSDSAYR
jgi:hypothetical protein